MWVRVLALVVVFGVSSFANVKIQVKGEVEYQIDGKKSNLKIAKEGQSITYMSGNGTLFIIDDVLDNKKMQLSSKNETYTATKNLGFFAKVIKVIFSPTKKDTKDSFQRAVTTCTKLSNKTTPLPINQHIDKIEYYRDGNLKAKYEIKNGKMLPKQDKKITPKKGDRIYLIDLKKGRFSKCYQIDY